MFYTLQTCSYLQNLRNRNVPKVASGAQEPSFTKGSCGLRATCKTEESSARAIIKFVCSQCPMLAFSSVAILDDVQSASHTDDNNHPSLENWIHPLSEFAGGDVWVEEPAGASSLKRKLLHMSKHACFLPARKRHRVLPWKGCRCVLVVYCIKDTSLLSREEQACLTSLGFVLPSASPHDTGLASHAKAKCKSCKPPDAADDAAPPNAYAPEQQVSLLQFASAASRTALELTTL